MADRRDHPAHSPEAETVDVTVGADAVEFSADDGLSLTFPRGPLEDALNPGKAQEHVSGDV